MTIFDDRERAFEAKWAHDEEMQFRILMRRNELLGLWAGAQLGLAGEEMERYVADLVALALRNGGSDALFLKLRTDLGVDYSDAVVRAKVSDCLEAATLEAGLEQRPATGAAAGGAHQAGGSSVNFARIVGGQDAEGPEQEDATHLRMLRKISRRASD